MSPSASPMHADDEDCLRLSETCANPKLAHEDERRLLRNPLRIAAYCSPLSRLRSATGVGQHVLGMFTALADDPRAQMSLISTAAQRSAILDVFPESLRQMPVHYLPPFERLMRATLMFTSLVGVERWTGDVDWVYAPKEQPVTTRKAKLATTVHDIRTFEAEIPGLPRSENGQTARRWKHTMDRIARNADVILSVSDFTRCKLIEHFQIEEHRIAVVGNGVSPRFFRQRQPGDVDVLNRFDVQADAYFMAVGSLTRRKGGDLLLDVAQRMARSDRFSGVKIVLAGRRHDADLLEQYEAMRRETPSLPLSLPGYVDDADLAVLLSSSLGLLFPSRYEGFGIPILEAMAAGAPVICTDTASLPEVAGGLARLVAPNSADALWEAIQEFSSQPASEREANVSAGRERAGEFTWPSCADRLLQALAARS